MSDPLVLHLSDDVLAQLRREAEALIRPPSPQVEKGSQQTGR